MPPRPPNTVTTGTNSFFVAAPLTKITGAVAVAVYVSTRSGYFTFGSLAFDALRVRDYGEAYRYFTSVLSFPSASQLVPGGLLLLHSLRKVEREMSSRKTTVMVIWVHLFSIACQVVAVPYLLYHDYNLQYSGPYALLGALFYFFHRYTPRITPNFVSILGFHLSDKLWIYLWYAPVAFGAGGSAGTGLFGTGILAAWIFDRYLSKVDVPDTLAAFAGRFVSRIGDGPPRTIVPGRGVQQPRAAAAAATAAAVAQAPQPVTPNAEAIEQLTNMGFPRARVVEALQATNNNVERAADRLLTQT